MEPSILLFPSPLALHRADWKSTKRARIRTEQSKKSFKREELGVGREGQPQAIGPLVQLQRLGLEVVQSSFHSQECVTLVTDMDTKKSSVKVLKFI